jgi:hypothetical protein
MRFKNKPLSSFPLKLFSPKPKISPPKTTITLNFSLISKDYVVSYRIITFLLPIMHEFGEKNELIVSSLHS